MDRRQFLRTGLSLTCCLTLVGCLDEVDVAIGSSDDSDETADAPDRTGERALARSVGRLNEAALALDVGDELEDGEGEFDPETPRESITSAREFLDTAAAELGADRQSDVDELRAYAAVLEALIDVAATITDDRLEDDIDAVSDAIADERLEEASATVDEIDETLAGATERFDAVESGLEELDEDRLAALSIVDLAEIEPGVSALDGVLASMTALVTAFESTVEGYECLERGEEYTDDDEYERARESFLEGESAFAASTTILEDGRADAPSGLETHFAVGLCRNDHLETAADHFVAASEAAMDRDRSAARRRRDDAEAALAAAEDC